MTALLQLRAKGGAGPLRLTSPSTVRAILDAHGIQIKKKYGQNFLIDQNILNKIIEAADVGPDDTVIEVGPGLGALTQALSERAGRVVAVEIDTQLIPVLHTVLGERPNVEIVQGDALRVDLEELAAKAHRVQVVANLPYYITSPLIMRFLESSLPLERMVVMVQAEVAERLQAGPGTKEYGSISIAVQYRAEVKRVTKVPRTVFLPQPNVDSAVVAMKIRPYPVRAQDERLFDRLVRAAFGQRRKTLRKALSSFAGELGVDVETLCERSGIDPTVRGESLPIESFVALADAFSEAIK